MVWFHRQQMDAMTNEAMTTEEETREDENEQEEVNNRVYTHCLSLGAVLHGSVRRDALRQVHDYGKEENISEDEIKGRESDLQVITDKHIQGLNSQQEKKEQEIMEV